MTAGEEVPASDDDALTTALDPQFVLPVRVLWWAEREPERPFLVEVDGRTLTFGEAATELRRWCGYLRSLGVGPGDWVLSALPPSINAYLLWMAASCLGACEVAVNPELRGQFLTHVLSDSGGRLCFVPPAAEPAIRACGVPDLHITVIGSDFVPTPELSWEQIGPLPRPIDPSCVIYTSGTTGMPKGAVLSWAQLAAIIGRIPRSMFSASDAAYAFHPTFHVTGRTPLLSMIDTGGRVVVREKFSATEFWSDVRTYGCTTSTPHVALLLATPAKPDDADNPLRVGFSGNDVGLTLRFAERFGVTMMKSYGSTEAGFPIVQPVLTPEGRTGFLRRGYAARIVDEVAQDVPDGTPGELWIRPPARPLMLLGYLGRDDLTDNAIVNGWYRTGDLLIRWPDGRFSFVDRKEDTIRHLGENISSSALEGEVTADPEILECAAIGVPNRNTGEDVLIAVIPADLPSFDPTRFFARLAPNLPKYMHPSYIVVCEELPRTATLKIRKVGLLEHLDLDRAWRAPARLPLADRVARGETP